MDDLKMQQKDLTYVPKPKWHKIVYGNDKNSNKTGEILCSFLICQ